MDVIQNITSILTADLLTSSLWAAPTNGVVVAPYFMLPIVMMAYFGTKNRKSLHDRNNRETSKHLALLETLSEAKIQEKYGESLKKFSQTTMALVLNKLFVNNTDSLTPEIVDVASRMGFEYQYFGGHNQRFTVRKRIKEYMIEQSFNIENSINIRELWNIPIVLLNGVQFNGMWEYPFDIKYSKWIRFWTDQYRYKLVEAMHFEAVFPYAAFCDMQIVQIPYKFDSNLALMIVLPNKIHGLRQIVSNLERVQSKILNAIFEYQDVAIDVPIFELEEKSELTNVLYKMSFGNLFRSNTTYDNFLNDTKKISFENVKHHVGVVANATVTDPDSVIYHCPDEVIDFKVNRPFLFYILDLETRIPFFSGLVTNFEGNGRVEHSVEFDNEKNVDAKEHCKEL